MDCTAELDKLSVETTTDSHSVEEVPIDPKDLYNAASEGDIDSITSKLAQGNNNKSLLTWRNEMHNNQTALHAAAKEGHDPVVLALLKAGASPDVKEGHGRTPMHLAASREHKEVYTALLEAGASPDVEDEDGLTPVQVAACLDFYNAAYKGDIDYITSKLAQENNNSSMIKNLLTWQDETIYNQTALHIAGKWGQGPVVLALIKAGASPDVKEGRGRTPLHLAAYRGHKEVYTALLEAGASPDVEDENGMTPVHLDACLDFYLAVHDGDIDYITSKLEQENKEMLLTWGSEVHHKETALHAAVKPGHGPVLLALLESGASPDMGDLYGRTPLYKAAERGLIEVLTALLEAGASPNVEDKDGMTPVHVAAYEERTEALRALLQPQYQANINQQDNEGRTPVYYTACYCINDTLEVLIDHGADVSIASNPGSLASRTPLLEAAKRIYSSTAELLINAGARLDHADDDEGMTVLHYAARNWWTEIVSLILRKGADKSIRDKQGRTPADHAREEGKNELAELIDNWQ